MLKIPIEFQEQLIVARSAQEAAWQKVEDELDQNVEEQHPEAAKDERKARIAK